jgi:uncharacterized protein YbjT (DUF2867 family)
MDVLVIGGSGFIGTALCTELDSRGHDVTALSRTPDGTDLPDSVETVMGDVTAYDSIASAFEGNDVVVNLVALSPLFKPKGGNSKHFDVHLGGTENIVRAAQEHDVGTLVQMSALGADPNGDTAYIRSKGQAEVAVSESGLNYVIIRPSIVFGDGGEFVPFTKKLTTPFVTGLPGGGDRTRFQLIWVGDLVPMLADAIEGDERNSIYELAGPEVLTLADVTKLVYRANGQSVTILPIPMQIVDLGLSVIGPLPGVPMGTDQAKSLRMDNTTEFNDIEAFGVTTDELMTFESYLGLPSEGQTR